MWSKWIDFCEEREKRVIASRNSFSWTEVRVGDVYVTYSIVMFRVCSSQSCFYKRSPGAVLCKFHNNRTYPVTPLFRILLNLSVRFKGGTVVRVCARRTPIRRCHQREAGLLHLCRRQVTNNWSFIGYNTGIRRSYPPNLKHLLF